MILAFAISDYLSLIGPIIGLAGGLGAAYAVARSAVATRTIELWKQQAEALKERLNTEKDSLAECKEHSYKLSVEIAELRAAQDTWIKMLSSAIDPKIVEKMAADSRKVMKSNAAHSTRVSKRSNPREVKNS